MSFDFSEGQGHNKKLGVPPGSGRYRWGVAEKQLLLPAPQRSSSSEPLMALSLANNNSQ